MNDNELMKYLIEEEQHAFSGWDFSYLNKRWENDNLPWNYKEIVLENIKPDMNMLDMGTGGGEFLLTLNHPFKLTSVTEAYPPNVKLCQEQLAPKGIKVYPINDDDLLNDIKDKSFDIIINRHESYLEKEVFRTLKDNGLFITQQVGAYNNNDLVTFFDPSHEIQFSKMTLEKSVNRLIEAGFKVLYQAEFFPKVKFFDLGAVAFYAKIIKWEFLNFNVKDNFDKFKELDLILKKDGFVTSTRHRFIIIAKK